MLNSTTGQAKDKYRYDPYGEFSHGGYLRSSETHYENFYGYNGEDYNRLSGLEYLRARYYEPETGRFLTRDTYLGSIMEPLTLNRYAYGVNNPVMNIDPSGHWPKWLSNVTKKVTSAVSSAWNSTKDFVSKAASTVGNAISNAVKEVKSWVSPINETKNNVKTAAESNVYNFKGSLRNTFENIQQQFKPAITTRDYPNEVVRANMVSVKNSYESAQYVKSQKYEYKDKISQGISNTDSNNLAVGLGTTIAAPWGYMGANSYVNGTGGTIAGISRVASTAILTGGLTALFTLLWPSVTVNESEVGWTQPTQASQDTQNTDESQDSEGAVNSVDDIIDDATETTNGKGVARNFEKSGGYEQTLKDFESLNPTNVKDIQTQYGTGKVGTLSAETKVVARQGSTTGGSTLEITVSKKKIFKVRY